VFAEVELEKDLLRQGVSYRYCFQKRESEKGSMENEFLYQRYYPFHNSYRMIKILDDIGKHLDFLDKHLQERRNSKSMEVQQKFYQLNTN
jgi:hypothetical protein